MTAEQLKDLGEIKIREAVKEDAPKVVDYLAKIGGETNFLTFGPGELITSVSDEEASIEEKRKAINKVIIVAVVEDNVIGILSFTGGERPRVQHIGEFGITVLKDYWDQGIGTEMVDQLIKWAKPSNVVRKINLRVRSDNYRAIHVYEKLGFHHEGVTTRDFYIDGEFYDSIRMGMHID